MTKKVTEKKESETEEHGGEEILHMSVCSHCMDELENSMFLLVLIAYSYRGPSTDLYGLKRIQSFLEAVIAHRQKTKKIPQDIAEKAEKVMQ